MKSTEAQLKKAFTTLLANKGFLHHLGNTLVRVVDDVIITAAKSKIIICLLLILSVNINAQSRSKNKTDDTTFFFSKIFKYPINYISENKVNWNTSDSFVLVDYYTNFQYFDSIHIAFADTLKDYLIDVLVSNPIINILLDTTQKWHQNEFSWGTRVVKNDKFLKIASKVTIQQTLGLNRISAISDPLFNNKRNIAMIKADYSALNRTLNTCDFAIILYRLEDKTWKPISRLGYECTFE
jgi:hypothetical protein